jgi:hypothetical protein
MHLLSFITVFEFGFAQHVRGGSPSIGLAEKSRLVSDSVRMICGVGRIDCARLKQFRDGFQISSNISYVHFPPPVLKKYFAKPAAFRRRAMQNTSCGFVAHALFARFRPFVPHF